MERREQSTGIWRAIFLCCPLSEARQFGLRLQRWVLNGVAETGDKRWSCTAGLRHTLGDQECKIFRGADLKDGWRRIQADRRVAERMRTGMHALDVYDTKIGRAHV